MGSWTRALILAGVLLVGGVVAGLSSADERTDFQVEEEPSAVAPLDPLDGIDPYGTGDSIHAGVRSQICVGGLPPGSAAFVRWLAPLRGIERSETLSCRLIAPPPGSGSRNIPPGDETFYENWSSHATGRAVDFQIGRSIATGDLLVDYLLATRGGIPHLVARRLGVMQIIWDGGCWEAREEQSRMSIHSAADMRAQYPCPAGAAHRDHPHITLSFDGAAGMTSGYALLGDAPPLDLPAEFFEPGPNHYGRGRG